MQFKLSTAILTALVAAMSVSALPTRGADYTDLAARSTAEDLAYLEARYSPEVDYETYFARDVAPSGGDVVELVARNSLLQLMGLARNQKSITLAQTIAFDIMDKECDSAQTKGLKDKKARKQCHKYIKHLKEITGEALWGFQAWHNATEKAIPHGVALDLLSISTNGKEKTITHSSSTSTISSTSTLHVQQQQFPGAANPYGAIPPTAGAPAGYPMPGGYPAPASPYPYAAPPYGAGYVPRS